jgi:GT2 family glycosyltransferase
MDYPRERYEVVVVDDGGETDTQGVVSRIEPGMRSTCLRVPHGGPAAARNAGVAASAGEMIAFTDDDCTVDPRWLIRLAGRFSGMCGTLVGGRVMNALASNRYSSASQGLQDFLYRWYHEERGGELRFFTTNNLALSRPDFDSIGGFDETFTFASEDRDLSDRAIGDGLSLVYAPDAIVHHAHELGLGQFLRQHYQYGKGAAQFRSRRRARRRARVRLEPPAFYYGMLVSPFKSGSAEPIVGSLLLLASQSALLAGAVTRAATLAIGNGRA